MKNSEMRWLVKNKVWKKKKQGLKKNADELKKELEIKRKILRNWILN